MKATALNRRVTAWKGIPVERTVAMSFGLAALLGAIGGVVFTPLISTWFDIGLAIAAPGRTPRHTAFVVGSDREQLIVLSDTARMLTPCLRRSVRGTDSSDSNDSSSQSEVENTHVIDLYQRVCVRYLVGVKGAQRHWRREWDSNPRYGFPHTRFPSVRLKPLGHLSGGLLLKGRDGFCKGLRAAAAAFP
jgi:hypothetical protein